MSYRIFASEICSRFLWSKNGWFFSYLDYVSVMAYDYYGAWDNVTGINAPLYGKDLPGGEEEDDEKWKNVVCDG